MAGSLGFIKIKHSALKKKKKSPGNEKTSYGLGDIFAKVTSDNELLSKIYQELIKLKSKNTYNSI